MSKNDESMLKNQNAGFLDLDAYEYVIYHYVNQNDLLKARVACGLAMETYPYSSELLLDYAMFWPIAAKTILLWRLSKKQNISFRMTLI